MEDTISRYQFIITAKLVTDLFSFIFETDQTKEKVSNVYFVVQKSVHLGRLWVNLICFHYFMMRTPALYNSGMQQGIMNNTENLIMNNK